jgi:hypothetical protein
VNPQSCPFHPEIRGPKRPLQNLPASAVGFVEAARFLGGQLSDGDPGTLWIERRARNCNCAHNPFEVRVELWPGSR